MPNSIQKVLKWASAALSSASETPRLDAELLLAFVLQKPRSYLFSWPEKALSEKQWVDFQHLVSKRQVPTPVAYLLGQREFYYLEFTVNDSVLVPRPETELLVEQALLICNRDRPQRIIDLGTGSGIIAVTVKKHYPQVEFWATDIDAKCLEVAAINAERHGVEINFLQSAWYQQLPTDRSFDLILSNPPYIAGDHSFLSRGDLPAEPQIALTPGASGLESLQTIIGEARQYLKSGGSLVVEHGYDQQKPVADLFTDNGFVDIHCFDDFNGHPRVSLGQMKD